MPVPTFHLVEELTPTKGTHQALVLWGLSVPGRTSPPAFQGSPPYSPAQRPASNPHPQPLSNCWESLTCSR